MNFSVNSIISHINKNYFAKAYAYEVKIYGSSIGGPSEVADATPDVTMNCNAVNVPGVNIGFVMHKRNSIGLNHNQIVGKSFTEMNMTFYESEFGKERAYFVKWVDSMFDNETQRFNYFKNFAKVISISTYNKKNQKTYEAIMYDCFPSNISPLDRSYASGDSIPQFNVNIQFQNMEERFFEKENGSNTIFSGLFNR